MGSLKSVLFGTGGNMAAFYGGQPENWQKVRGEVVLVYDGKDARAEAHWAQEKSVGYVEEKFVRWLEK